jgi:hypothetical protein
MKKALFFTLSTLLISLGAFAQSWNLTGNNNATPTSILGNTNAVPLRLFTKNVARITIDTFGFVGINSAHPVSTLDVRGTQFLSGQLKFGTGAHNIQFANPTATANKPMIFMFTTNGQPARMIIAHSPAFPNYGLQYDGDATVNMNFLGNGSPVLSVGLGSQNIGIRTTTPAFPLSFDNNLGDKISLWGNAGVHYGLGIQSQTLQMHTDGSGSDIVFGYGQSSALTENVRMKGNGITIFGAATPLFPYRIFMNHSSFGLGMQFSGSTDYWEMVPFTNLDLYFDDSFRGAFNSTTGAYSSVSDARLKTNIKPMESVLDKINQLKPSSYQFKDVKDEQFYDGFVAQDVMKVFPNLVFHNVQKERKLDVYTMNYAGFGVIAIKGIQELVEKSTKQQDEIQLLKDEIKELKTMMSKLAPGQFQNVSSASMDQNSPNPARSSTSISYSLPTNNNSAQLQLIDNLGRTVKSIQLNSSGRINLDLSSLSSGTYTYSLVVDGKVVETKKLVKASE